MRLPLEKWIEESSLPTDAQQAFLEAITCYKGGAYRAAVLFSYLGLAQVIRFRVLHAPRPASMSEGEWNDRLGKLRGEDSWDKQVFELTQMTDRKRPFDLSNDVRTQLAYWKDRRNDSAHFKGNSIDASHVESLWSFIVSNSAKLVVVGSREHILNRIIRHFDRNATPPGTDIAPLAREVRTAVAADRLVDFFESITERLVIRLGDVTVPRREERGQLFSALLRSGGAELSVQLLDFLVVREPLLLDVLRVDPSLVSSLHDRPEILRGLWRASLFAEYDKAADLEIYVAMARNGLIPGTQLDEAHACVVEKLVNAEVPEPCIGALRAAGFFEILQRKVQARLSTFDWANDRSRLIVQCVDVLGLSDDTIKALCSVFGSEFHPWHARSGLAKYFSENADKRSELEQRAEVLGLEVPARLTSA